MVIIMLITVYPVWYSLINSLNSAKDISRNGYAMLWTRDFTLESWKAVLGDMEIIKAFGITFARTVIVTFLQTLITAMFAYGFPGKSGGEEILYCDWFSQHVSERRSDRLFYSV